MSYCRFGEGDVYIFLSVIGKLECCGCFLQKTEWIETYNSIIGGYLKPVPPIIQTNFQTTQELLDHLDLHLKAGHHVPLDCISELKEDQEENDQWIREFNDKAAMENINSNLD